MGQRQTDVSIRYGHKVSVITESYNTDSIEPYIKPVLKFDWRFENMAT